MEIATKIIEISKKNNLKDLDATTIAFAIQKALGYHVLIYDGEHPEGIDYGRIYYVNNEVHALELIDMEKNIHYVRFKKSSSSFRKEIIKAPNIVIVDKFNCRDADNLFKS